MPRNTKPCSKYIALIAALDTIKVKVHVLNGGKPVPRAAAAYGWQLKTQQKHDYKSNQWKNSLLKIQLPVSLQEIEKGHILGHKSIFRFFFHPT